jgi:hypothetical protein
MPFFCQLAGTISRLQKRNFSFYPAETLTGLPAAHLISSKER